jgi:hypothetical protein
MRAGENGNMHGIEPEEQQALINQCRANYVAGRDTLNKESFALQCPSSSLMRNPSSSSTYNVNHPNNCTQTNATTLGNSHLHVSSICLFRDLFTVNKNNRPVIIWKA